MGPLRRTFLLLLVILVAASSGCVYWRLLQFKRQLGDFSEHFEFRGEERYGLVAVHPVLTGSDFDGLMEVEPTGLLRDERGLWRIYEFEKHPADGGEVLAYDFLFVEDMLVEILFPRQFSELYPGDSLAEFLRALGGADVAKREKSARSDSFDAKYIDALPRRELTLRVLGEPSEPPGTCEDGGEFLTYRYRIRTGSIGAKAEKRRSYGRFFYGKSGELIRVEAGIGDHELRFDIPRGDSSPGTGGESSDDR